MTINNAMKKYRLPNPTCSEDLETRWDKVLTFGDKVVMAGGYYIRPGSIACHVIFIWRFLRAWLLPIWATVAIMILCSINL
nr:MAG TPA: Nucleotide modification associated domain 4 [Caudoviricetes sp.]